MNDKDKFLAGLLFTTKFGRYSYNRIGFPTPFIMQHHSGHFENLGFVRGISDTAFYIEHETIIGPRNYMVPFSEIQFIS